VHCISGFQRIRHYGWLANGVRKVKLPLCRRVLGQASLGPPAVNTASGTATPGPPRPPWSEVCPACHVGQMQVQDTWFPQHIARDCARPLLGWDTS